MGCCCPGGGVPPCRVDARPIASPWLPWGDPCGWSCRLFWGVLVSGSGALGCYTPAGTTGAGGGAGGHSSVPVLWWLWLSSSCQQKWKKNCTPRGWFDSSSVPGLPPPGHCPDWAQPPRTLRSPPGWGRGQDTDTASGPGCCLPGVPRGSALHEPSPELPSLLIYPWMGNFCSDSVFQLGPPPQDLVPQFTLGTNGIIKLLISLTPLCLLLS